MEPPKRDRPPTPHRHDGTPLGDTVYRMVTKKLTHTSEFKALVSFFGREKIAALYRAERDRRGEENQPYEPAPASE